MFLISLAARDNPKDYLMILKKWMLSWSFTRSLNLISAFNYWRTDQSGQILL